MVGKVKFETRIKELIENVPDLAVLVEPLLIVRRVLREQIGVLHRRLLAIARDDDVCRRLMTTPGVGPVVALTYRATIAALQRLPVLCKPGHRTRNQWHDTHAAVVWPARRVGRGVAIGQR
jgi:hypothetical protein